MNHEQTRRAEEGPESVIPIVFAANDKYAPYAGAAIESIKEHASPRNLYRIYVLHTGLTPAHIQKLESNGFPWCEHDAGTYAGAVCIVDVFDKRRGIPVQHE